MQRSRSLLAVHSPPRLPWHLAARLLWFSLLAGIAADALLRVTPWGINVSILAVAITLCSAYVLGRSEGVTLEGEGRWLTFAALFFAASLAWRDSPTLNVGNWIAFGTASGLALLTARAGQVRRAGVTQYGIGLLY